MLRFVFDIIILSNIIRYTLKNCDELTEIKNFNPLDFLTTNIIHFSQMNL